MKSISERYADFIVRSRFEDLGAEVVQQAKKLILARFQQLLTEQFDAIVR